MPALAIMMVAIAGCGGAVSNYEVREETAVEERREVAELMTEQERLAEEDLERAASGPDCAAVCEIVGRICELGERVCTIAERHPGDSELSGRCTDSRMRCDRARQRGAENCSSEEEGDTLRCAAEQAE